MTKWAKIFIKDLGYQPGYWGLNNYVDANNLRDSATRSLLAAVKGNIWLAETGGIVNRNNHSKVTFPQNAAHAAKVDNYILHTIGSLSPRIQRIYLYEWDAEDQARQLGLGADLLHRRPAPGLRRARQDAAILGHQAELRDLARAADVRRRPRRPDRPAPAPPARPAERRAQPADSGWWMATRIATRYALASSVATRSRRLELSEAGSSAHSPYHGHSQAVAASSASVLQP